MWYTNIFTHIIHTALKQVPSIVRQITHQCFTNTSSLLIYCTNPIDRCFSLQHYTPRHVPPCFPLNQLSKPQNLILLSSYKLVYIEQLLQSSHIPHSFHSKKILFVLLCRVFRWTFIKLILQKLVLNEIIYVFIFLLWKYIYIKSTQFLTQK